MSHKKMQQGSGAPSFCWHCGSQLQRAPGKGQGLFYFRLVLGDEHQRRVHGDCYQPALEAGAKKL
jgi:hypothetical protein